MPHRKSLPRVSGMFGLVIMRDFPSKKHFSPCWMRLVVSNFAFWKTTLSHLYPPSSLLSHQWKTHQVTWVPAFGNLLPHPFHALTYLLPWKGSCSPSRNMEVNLHSEYEHFSILSGPNI